MNIKETYLRVIGHNTLLIFVIRYRGPRQFISLLFHRISRLLTISIDFRSIHKKKKETKISTRNFIQKKTIYFPSLFPILIYSPEIVTKNQTNFTYRKETEYHQIMLKRKFPRNTSKFPHLIRSNKGWSKVKEEEKKKDASSKANIESTI